MHSQVDPKDSDGSTEGWTVQKSKRAALLEKREEKAGQTGVSLSGAATKEKPAAFDIKLNSPGVKANQSKVSGGSARRKLAPPRGVSTRSFRLLASETSEGEVSRTSEVLRSRPSLVHSSPSTSKGPVPGSGSQKGKGRGRPVMERAPGPPAERATLPKTKGGAPGIRLGCE